MDLSPHALLAWYLEAGVDETIGALAPDRFALPEKAAAARPAVVPASSAPSVASVAFAPSAGGAGAVHPAQPIPHGSASSAHLAAGCRDLAGLRAAMESFDGLPLKRTAHHTVFADGNPDAKVMIIGEAPGAEEDRQGLPFVGRSGKLLDRMLASIGLDRTSVYITNVVPWRPTENRKPTADEVAVCLPFVIRHIELVDPAVLILLGGASAGALLARHEGINRLRGHWYDFSSQHLPRPVPAMASFHPAYLLRTPLAKREAWRDLIQVRKRLVSLNFA